MAVLMKVLISLSTSIFSLVLQLTNCAKFTMMQYINLSEMRKKRYRDYLEQELTSGVKICFLASKFSEILWGKVAISLQFHMWKQRGSGVFCCSLFLQQSSKKYQNSEASCMLCQYGEKIWYFDLYNLLSSYFQGG